MTEPGARAPAERSVPTPGTLEPIAPGATKGVIYTVLAALVGAAVVTGVAAVVLGGGWPEAWVAATIIAIVAALATLPIVLAALRLNPVMASQRVLAAGGFRAMLILAGAVIAYKGLGLAKIPIFVLTLGYYLVLLVAETLAAARAVGRKQEPTV